MDKFPELASKDGSLNSESPLLKEALRVLSEDASPTKFAKFTDRLNPDFDSPAGPYMAVMEAKMRISKGAETKTNNDSSRAKEQMLSNGRGSSPRVSGESNVTQQQLDRLEKSAVASGSKQDWQALLRARAEFEGRR